MAVKYVVGGNVFNFLMGGFGGSAGYVSWKWELQTNSQVRGITICDRRTLSLPVNHCHQVQVRVDKNTRN